MGFKQINREELETSLSPNIFGSPISTLAEMEIKKESEERNLIYLKEKISDVFLLQEETINIHSSSKDEMNIVGSGAISVVNTSKKDRLWDIQLGLAESDQFKIDCEKEIYLGNLEPETQQNIQYNIINPENLSEPIRVIENIEILTHELKLVNLEEENISFQRRETQDIDDLELRKDEILQSIREGEIQSIINQIFKLTNLPEKEKLEQIEYLAGLEKKIVRRLLQKKSKKTLKGLKHLIEDYQKVDLINKSRVLELALSQSIFDSEIVESLDVESSDKELAEEKKPAKKKEKKKSGKKKAVSPYEEELLRQRNVLEKEKAKLIKKEEEIRKVEENIKKQEEEIQKRRTFQEEGKQQKNKETKNLTELKNQDEIQKQDDTKKLEDLQKEEEKLHKLEGKIQKQKQTLKTVELDKKEKQKQKRDKEKLLKEGENKELEGDIQCLHDIIQKIEQSIQKQKAKIKKEEITAQNNNVDIQQQKTEIKKQDAARTEKIIQKQKEIEKIEDNKKKMGAKIAKLNETLEKQKNELTLLKEQFEQQKEILANQENKVKNEEEKIKKQQDIKKQRQLEKQEKLRRQKEIQNLIINYKKVLIRFFQGKTPNPENKLIEISKKLHDLNQLDHVQDLKEWVETIANMRDEKENWYFSLIKGLKTDPQLIELLQESPNLEGDINRIKTLIGIEHEGALEGEIERATTKREKTNHFLYFGKENRIKFTLNIKNTSPSTLKEFKLVKHLSKEFYELDGTDSLKSDVKIDLNQIRWSLSELGSQESAALTIYAKILPIKKEIFGTGPIVVFFIQEDIIPSQTKITAFNAFSHAMHLIKKKERENEPNKWDCSLVFKNNSEFNMDLKSILILDEAKENKILDLNLHTAGQTLIPPGETFVTESWEIENEVEPQFSRKIDYSITSNIKRIAKFNLKFDQNYFDLIDLQIEKKFLEASIKSFEKSEINESLFIKNVGTTPINGILIREAIPTDFLPPNNSSNFQIRISSGIDLSNNLEIRTFPQDMNPLKQHTLEIFINLTRFDPALSINVNEFLEINYILNAINPDYKKIYEFPLEVIPYYSITQEVDEFQQVHIALSESELPHIKVLHKRRNMEIGKEIYPGRTMDEFAISILINNKSDVEINDTTITDTVPNAFEIVSSNIEHSTTDSDQDGCYVISFGIEKIRPHHEKEIRYYIKNKSGEKFGFKELESFIVG